MLRYVTWSTTEPISLLAGRIRVNGEAFPQVRDSARAAEVGDSDALVVHIQAVIAQSLTEVLQGMEPSAEQLIGLRDDFASITLVSANRKLAGAGVTLLDLTIAETALAAG